MVKLEQIEASKAKNNRETGEGNKKTGTATDATSTESIDFVSP